MTQRQLFYENLAQTTSAPLAFEVNYAKGIYLYDKNNNEYIDMISGISVSNLGHNHPEVIKAVKEQVDKYMHVMVYGEFIQSPQVQLAKKLADILPNNLSCSYFVNSGSEAVEGALKLAKRYTGRNEIIAFKNAYHGSTQGALSVCGVEKLKNSFRPLLPNVKFLEYNNINDLENISENTSCVIIEPIQGEAGVIVPSEKYLKNLRIKCNETKTLLVFDEIQTGLGRTGELFAFEHYNVIPDILLLAKSFGGGLPLGAFISSKEIMNSLTNNPALGHISTFGGHPVSCAAALSNLNFIIKNKLWKNVKEKADLIKKNLSNNQSIKSIRNKGLLMAIQLENDKKVNDVINKCIKTGLITDWFLFAPDCFRIAPPLIINNEEITKACDILTKALK